MKKSTKKAVILSLDKETIDIINRLSETFKLTKSDVVSNVFKSMSSNNDFDSWLETIRKANEIAKIVIRPDFT